MIINRSYTVNSRNHVVLDDGTELGQKRKQYMYTQLLQNYELEILLATDEFCKKHGINYYLAEGTLLGAIRHKGFIPWDDDIDICMFRDDYEKFKLLASKEFTEGFVVDCEYTNPKHWTNIMQIEMAKPTPYVKKRLEGIALYNGPCIDIFPIDYVEEDNPEVLTERKDRIHRLRRALWIKSGLHNRAWYKSFKKRMTLYYPLKFYGMTRSMEAIRKECFSLMMEDNEKECSFAINYGSLYNVIKETFPLEWFGEPRMVEFEGHAFPCPQESEKILEKIYSNYLALPTVKKRKNKHIFTPDDKDDLSIYDEETAEIIRKMKILEEEEAIARAAEYAALGINPEEIEKKPQSRLKKKIKKNKKKIRNFLKRRVYDLKSRKKQESLEAPLDEKAVLFDAFSGLGILDSPRAIFKRMLEREEFSDYHYIWNIQERKIVDENLLEFEGLPNVSIVDRGSDEFFSAMATSKYLISNTSFPEDFTRREGQKYLNTWHGVPTKVMGYERPGQKVLSTRNVVRNFLNATHIISANDFTAETMYKKAYKLEGIYEGKLIDSPLPRTDAIYNTNSEYIKDKLESVGIYTNKKIILYAPTWKGDSYKNFDKDTEELRNAVKTLREGINSDEYDVFLRVHYFLYRAIEADEELRRICIPFTIDTNELLSVVDILISDYSSIFFDFLGTKRPILFYVPDLDEYTTNRGLYIPLEDLPGPVGQTLEEITSYINNLDQIKEQYYEKYEEMYKWCSGKEDGNATDRVIDSLVFDKGISTINCNNNKKKLLIMAEFGKDFAARNELEIMLNHIDYRTYDVTLLAGAPTVSTTRKVLEEINENVRILINNRKPNTSRANRIKAFEGVNNGTITPTRAAQIMNMDKEWHRLFGDAHFDEMVLVHPEKRAFELWLILAIYAPVEKKSFVIGAKGLTGPYAVEGNIEGFSIFPTISSYEETLT